MKIKFLRTLFTACAFCAVIAAAGCGSQAQNQTAAPAATAAPQQDETPQYIVFNGENIDLNDYASLISFFGQLSFNNTEIENSADFIAAAEQSGASHLLDLYNYINSLPDSESIALHREALEALNN